MDPPGSPKRRRTVSTSKTPSRHPRPQPNKNAPNLNNDGKRSREVQEFADNIQPAAKRFLFGSTTSVNPADSERPDTAAVHADESTGFQSGTHEHLFTVRLGKGKTTPIVRKHYHQDMMSHPYFSQNPDACLVACFQDKPVLYKYIFIYIPFYILYGGSNQQFLVLCCKVDEEKSINHKFLILASFKHS